MPPINAIEAYKDTPTTELAERLAMYGTMKTGFLNEILLPIIDKAHKLDNPAINKLLTFALEHTAVKVFFGGVGIEKTEKRAEKLLERNVGVILDYAAPEDNQHPAEETFNAVKNEYEAAIKAAARLKERFHYDQSTNVSLAIKISTLMPFDDMQRVSRKLDEQFDGSTLDSEEQAILDRIQTITNTLLDHTKESNVGVYIDAEQTRVNSIIRKVAFNALEAGHAVNVTVQAYLKDTVERVDELLELTNDRPDLQQNLGVKLVRGAYIGDDKELGKIWHSGTKEAATYDDGSKALTDNSYDAAFETLYRSGKFALITVATHNEESLKKAARLMEEERQNFSKVDTASLQGMGDILPTGNLQRSKYLPYPNREDLLGAVAYFARRGTEFMGQTGAESGLTRGEQEYQAVKEAFLDRLPKPTRYVTEKMVDALDMVSQRLAGAVANRSK